MLRRVAAASHNGPIALTDPNDLPIVHAHMPGRQPRYRTGKAAPTAFAQLLDALFIEAGKPPVV